MLRPRLVRYYIILALSILPGIFSGRALHALELEHNSLQREKEATRLLLDQGEQRLHLHLQEQEWEEELLRSTLEESSIHTDIQPGSSLSEAGYARVRQELLRNDEERLSRSWELREEFPAAHGGERSTHNGILLPLSPLSGGIVQGENRHTLSLPPDTRSAGEESSARTLLHREEDNLESETGATQQPVKRLRNYHSLRNGYIHRSCTDSQFPPSGSALQLAHTAVFAFVPSPLSFRPLLAPSHPPSIVCEENRTHLSSFRTRPVRIAI